MTGERYAPVPEAACDRVDPVRRAAAVAFAGSSLMLAGGMAIHGVRLLATCYLAKCSEQKASGSVNSAIVVLSGAYLALVGSVVGTRAISQSRPSAARSAAAFALGLGVGLCAVLVGNWLGGWTENVGLFATIGAFTVVLVPPRTPRWFVGVVLGTSVAAAFGDVPLPGVPLALGVLAIGSLLDVPTRTVDQHGLP